MSTGLHKDLANAEIHTIAAWVYADEAARLAATGFVASDLYKVCWQISTQTLFVLSSYSPIIWVELAAGSGQLLNKVELLVRNESGATILKGKCVYASGWNDTEQRVLVELADKADPDKRPAIGVVNVELANNTNGTVLAVGRLSGVDTSAWALTDQLVLGTNGALSRPPPDVDPFTGEVQNMGVVARVHASDGHIVVLTDGLQTTSADEVFALVGTSGTPSKTNKYVTDADARNTNARTPTSHATSHKGDGGDAIAVATQAVAGLESAADKTKLDGIASGATATPLTSTAPVDVTKATAAVGTSGEAARQDHKHDITTAAPGATGVATASAQGTATTLARSDHAHQSNTAPAAVTKATAAIGTSGQPARADHKHDITTAAASAQVPGDSAAEGSATSLARSDHKHGLPAYGTGSGTICQGNDARLSDARTPTGSAGGDLTGSTYPNPTVANSAITNAKLADMVQSTIKGRAAGAGTGAPVDLTSAQATAILDAFTSALKGLAPASGGGTTNYLRADGTWAAPPGAGSTFGGNFQQGSSDGESSTTSGTFQQKLRITTASLPAGTYRIGFYYEWQKSGLTDFASRVQVNDTTNCMEGFEEAPDAGNDQWFPRGGFYYYTGSGVLNIDLDYHNGNQDTAYIRRARLEIWRVS